MCSYVRAYAVYTCTKLYEYTLYLYSTYSKRGLRLLLWAPGDYENWEGTLIKLGGHNINLGGGAGPLAGYVPGSQHSNYYFM